MLCWIKQMSTKIAQAFKSISDYGEVKDELDKKRYKRLHDDFENLLQELSYKECCKWKQRSKWFKNSRQQMPSLDALSTFIHGEGEGEGEG